MKHCICGFRYIVWTKNGVNSVLIITQNKQTTDETLNCFQKTLKSITHNCIILHSFMATLVINKLLWIKKNNLLPEGGYINISEFILYSP